MAVKPKILAGIGMVVIHPDAIHINGQRVPIDMRCAVATITGGSSIYEEPGIVIERQPNSKLDLGVAAVSIKPVGWEKGVVVSYRQFTEA